MSAHLKSAVVGAIAALFVVAATSAFAGSGVGDVFNLGQGNSVDATSRLTGTTSGAQLQFSNANDSFPSILGMSDSGSGAALYGQHTGATGSGAAVRGQSASQSAPGVLGVNTADGPGLSAIVNAGHPPIKVNSNSKVALLNADLLDSFDANELVRVSRGGIQNLFPGSTFAGVTSTTIQAPSAGFALVMAATTTYTNNAGCAPCQSYARLADTTTGATSPAIDTQLVTGSTVDQASLSPVWVFPVTAGSHTFELQKATFFSNSYTTFFNPTITAVYIPFGATGGSGLKAPR
jgi:hypothetical protein